MKAFITRDTPVTDEVLNTIAYLPTKSLSRIVEDGFFKKLTDRDFMRIGVLLAMKGYEEGGSPIGGVVMSTRSGDLDPGVVTFLGRSEGLSSFQHGARL